MILTIDGQCPAIVNARVRNHLILCSTSNHLAIVLDVGGEVDGGLGHILHLLYDHHVSLLLHQDPIQPPTDPRVGS